MDVRCHLHALFRGIRQRLIMRNRGAWDLAHEEHGHFVELVQLDALAVEGDFEFLTLRAFAEDLAEAELGQ